MRIAIYVRVSTQRQAQTQTIDQQLDRLKRVAADRQWSLPDDHIFRDDGYSGASLGGPAWTGSATSPRWPSSTAS